MKPVVNLYKLGRMRYLKALDVQQTLFERLKAQITLLSIKNENFQFKDHSVIGNNCQHETNKIANQQHFSNNTTTVNYQLCSDNRNSLVLVEHEPVYTIGIRSKQYNDDYVLKLKQQLLEHNLKADFVTTNRGGLITFHGPGQLVAYPIIYLGDFTHTIQNRSVKAYVNLLETIIIDTLDKVGLKGAHTIREYPGVWLDSGERKIAFIGISCKRFVTMHGISINCDCDLSWFKHIVSCGIAGKEITSISQEYLYKNSAQSLIIDRQKVNLTNDNLDMSFRESSMIENAINFQSSNPERLINTNDNSRSTVENVSKEFCQSFSKHFDCVLEEKHFPEP